MGNSKELKIDYFYKTIKNAKGQKHTLFDYEKIYNDPATVFFIISQRGALGKSTQAKYLSRILYDKYGLKTQWIMNTLPQLEKEMTKHLTKPRQYLDNFTGKEKLVSSSKTLYADEDDKKSAYTHFVALSVGETEKSSRDDVELVIWDEFNVSQNKVVGGVVDAFSSLMATNSDAVNKTSMKKIIIHGNFKTLNNELALALGLTKVEGEITTKYKDDGTPFLRILVPQFDQQEREDFIEKHRNDPHYVLQKMLGKAEHVFFNENLHDEITNIDANLTSAKKDGGKRRVFITMKNKFYVFDRISNSTKYYIRGLTPAEVEKVKGRVRWISLSTTDVVEGSAYLLSFKENLRQIFAKGMMWYDTSYTRENFMRMIRK